MKIERGQTAVVTGGASGIGRAIAHALAERGVSLVIADIESEAIAESERELAATGVEVLGVEVDVSKAESVAALAERTLERFGAPHILCNNAGVGSGGPLHELTLDDWNWVLSVNLNGVIHGIHYFLPAMREAGRPAHIVNTASVAGLVTAPWMGPYNASKYAVVAITETFAQEYSEESIGTSVLCPGFVNTRIGESGRNAPAGANVSTPRPEMADMMADLLTTGLEPDTVATRVVEAIENDDLYILTHEELTPIVEQRFAAIRDAAPRPTS
jgi:NAD(P)-dependent dehydrogenase (short-subunit alcohol dehydrogenase family)